jgi:hypothetical protein
MSQTKADLEIEKLEERQRQLKARIQEKKNKRAARTKLEKRKADTRVKAICAGLMFATIREKESFGPLLFENFAKLKVLREIDAETLIRHLPKELSEALANGLQKEQKFLHLLENDNE